VSDAGNVVVIVRYEECGGPRCVEQFAYQIRQALAEFGVEAGERLVEQKNLGGWRECSCQSDAPCLTPRQRVNVLIGVIGEADSIEPFVDDGADSSPIEALHAESEGDVAGDVEVGKEL
jgi:hypothetical protein